MKLARAVLKLARAFCEVYGGVGNVNELPGRFVEPSGRFPDAHALLISIWISAGTPEMISW